MGCACAGGSRGVRPAGFDRAVRPASASYGGPHCTPQTTQLIDHPEAMRRIVTILNQSLPK